MKYVRYFFFVCLFVFVPVSDGALAQSSGTEIRLPTIFLDSFGGDDRAVELDRAYMTFNNRITAVLEAYYYKRRKIFQFLHPAFIYKPKNLVRSYEAYEAASAERDKVLEEITALYGRSDRYLEEGIAGFGGGEEGKARDLWARLDQQTVSRLKKFFSLEKKFLYGFERQVRFLQDHVGTYYFVEKRIAFHDVSDGEYYRRVSDGLTKISDKQFRVVLAQNISTR